MSGRKRKLHVINIGKFGLDEGAVQEIKRQLEEKGIVKIRFLSSVVRNKKEFKEKIEELLSKVRCKVVKEIGHTVIIKRE